MITEKQIVGLGVVIFVRDGSTVRQHPVQLTVQHQRSVLNFIRHKLQGGRLQALQEPRRIIEP